MLKRHPGGHSMLINTTLTLHHWQRCCSLRMGSTLQTSPFLRTLSSVNLTIRHLSVVMSTSLQLQPVRPMSKSVAANIYQIYQSVKTHFQNECILWFKSMLNKQMRQRRSEGNEKQFRSKSVFFSFFFFPICSFHVFPIVRGDFRVELSLVVNSCCLHGLENLS